MVVRVKSYIGAVHGMVLTNQWRNGKEHARAILTTHSGLRVVERTYSDVAKSLKSMHFFDQHNGRYSTVVDGPCHSCVSVRRHHGTTISQHTRTVSGRGEKEGEVQVSWRGSTMMNILDWTIKTLPKQLSIGKDQSDMLHVSLQSSGVPRWR
jgi:hypothetical protein